MTLPEELKEAALTGDVEFLKKCVNSSQPPPTDFYLTYFPKPDDDSRSYGNIFHMAANENREEFIREVIRLLTPEAILQLLLQPKNETQKWNPLHIIAYAGNLQIVELFLNMFRSSRSRLRSLSDLSKRPWLLKDYLGRTPCLVAMQSNHEECALTILKMDTELICKIPDDRGSYVLCEAVRRNLSNLALQILRSPHFAGCTGYEGYTAFHWVQNLNFSEETKEIFRRLLEREPDLIKQHNEYGKSAFHLWVSYGKIWPFRCLQEFDIIARDFTDLVVDVKSVFTDLVLNDEGETPFFMALKCQYEKLAMYILSMDYKVAIKCQKNVLFLAIEKGCHQVTEKILEIVDRHGLTGLLTNDEQNVLHLAPLCTDDLCKQLIEKYPELMKGVSKRGITVLHNWIRNGAKEWHIKFVWESKWRSAFSKLIGAMDYDDRNNPFHVAATTTHEEKDLIVKLLVQAYKEEYPNWNASSIGELPWFKKNIEDEGPLQLAIRNRHETLALYILSLHQADHINELLDYYEPEHSTLFLAIDSNCFQVAKEILSRLDKKCWNKYLRDSCNGKNILHLASNLKDKEFGLFLIDNAQEFIYEVDNKRLSPLDEAFGIDAAWFVKAIQEKYSSVLEKLPLAWVHACEKGHMSTLRAFVEYNPGKFRDVCIKCKDSPLHHVQLPNLTDYEELLKIERLRDLINLQDSQGETPLHKAIKKRDIFLTETLLRMDKISYNIKDKDKNSAINLLVQACDDECEWDQMCERIGFDPRIETTYFQYKPQSLLELRNTQSVVGALIATITFAAGFTIPGGLKQDSGEAILVRKAAFLVFLISDALALCCSMLVLICFLKFPGQESRESQALMIRMKDVLLLSLYATIVAFTGAVYLVISPKSLWTAIVIIVICSLVGILSHKTFLYKVLFIPTYKKNKLNHNRPMSQDSQLEAGIRRNNEREHLD